MLVTGAYLAEVLRRIALNLEGFGFEFMPAPLVVAHLQVGLTMQTRC